MNYINYIISAVIIIVVSCIFIVAKPSQTLGAEKYEMVDVIRRVATDYRAEQGFNNQCSINGGKVSLGAVLYALAIQEGGYIDGTIGDKTNNWGSLHAPVGVKKVVGYIRADGSRTRPKYETPYDGVYEKAHLIATKKLYNGCNISYKQLYAYIVGPNANPNKLHPTLVGGKRVSNSTYVKHHLSKMIKNAKEFDNTQLPIPSKNGTTSHSKPTKECHKVKSIQSADYIQLDVDGDMYRQFDVKLPKNKKIDVYNCYGSKK